MLNFNLKSRHLVSKLQKYARSLSNETAFVFLEDGKQETGHITYFDLDQKARAIAAFLQEKNSYGQRVLLLYPAGIEFISAFMGCLYAGVIAVPVHCPAVDELEKVNHFLSLVGKDADISGIFTNKEYIEKIQKIFLQESNPSEIFIRDIYTIEQEKSNCYKIPKIKNETIAYLQYTSGSTSSPKAVIIRHDNLIHSLKSSGKAWHYSQKSVSLSWAPHSHVYGLVVGLLVPLYHGSLGIIMSPIAFIKRPLNWLEAITQYKVTHTGCPNFGYDLCIHEIEDSELAALHLQSWKVAINGGENVQYETIKKFSEKFKKSGFRQNSFCSAYGMSEVTGTVAVTGYQKEPTLLEKFHRQYVTNGQLIAGLEVLIVDPETKVPVKKGEIGEVWLAGKAVASGYWHQSDEANQMFNVFVKGSSVRYFRTGDLGFVEDNELCITGRLKEVIVIHGKKYFPTDLEIVITRSLQDFPVASNHIILSISDTHPEQIFFIQEVQENLSAEMQEQVIDTIYKTVREHFGIDLYDVLLVQPKSLPKTASGKLQRKMCEKYLLENKLLILKTHRSNYSGQTFLSLTTPKVYTDRDLKEFVATTLKVHFNQIELQKPMSQYNFDSITVVQFIAKVNEKFQLKLSPTILFEYGTLAEFFHDVINKFNQTKHTQFSSEKTNKPYSQEDVAIIGMSGIFPGADNIEALWSNMMAGKNAITEIPKERWNWESYFGDSGSDDNKTRVKWGGFINDIAQFDAEFFNISPREAELTDPQQRLFLQMVWNAIEDAGYATHELTKIKTGLFVGVFNNDYAELLQKEGIHDAYITTGITHSILANRVSFLLNLHGPSEAIDTACSSSLVAIHNAVMSIQKGDCEIAIAGGVNAILTPTIHLISSKAGMLSEDGKCHTFDKDANGYVRSEGVGVILLKSLSRAISDRDHIYGIIKGSAVNHGGHVSSLTVPNPIAQADVIAMACRRAQIDVSTVSYIETHGTGTVLGDPIEINGLKKAFEIINKDLAPQYCGLGSVKTHIGHLEAAAGIAGVIKVLLAMKYQQIPGNLHFHELNPYIELQNSPFYIVNQSQIWERSKTNEGKEIPRRAGVSSFGYGGTNAHIILEEAPYNEPKIEDISLLPRLIAISAKTHSALKKRILELYQYLEKNNVSLERLSFTLNLGREHLLKRCALVVNSINELKDSLKQIIEGQHPENVIIHTEQENKIKNRPIYKELFKWLVHDLQSGKTNNWRDKLLALGDFFVEGHVVDWASLHQGEKRRIPLPVYPFAKNHYWIPDKTQMSTQLRESPQKINMNLKETVVIDLKEDISALLKIQANKINLSSSLSELGFDSIAFKELAVNLEKKYNIELNPSIFFTYSNIERISEYLLEEFPEVLRNFYHFDRDSSQPATYSEIQFSQKSSTAEPIAIIGMQGYFPQSPDLVSFWQHLEAGDDLVIEIPSERWDWHQYYGDSIKNNAKTNSKWGGLIKDVDKFDAGFFNISAREANLMDPQHRLLMEIVWKTIEDAGYNPFSLSHQKVGLFIGTEFSEYQTLIQSQHKIFHGHIATGNSHALLANRISYFLNLRGPSEVIDTACSSSLVAIHRAVNAIQQGECSAALAGGVSLMLNPDTFVITSQLGALSPDGRCKTFDKSANGYVKGEGVATILLKPLSQAEKDGDHIYGLIKGTAVNHGGKAQSLTAPNSEAQRDLLVDAYTQAGLDIETISYIEAHGTGTELGDPIEIEGLKQAFKKLGKVNNKKYFCGLGSVKTNIGHLEPASGVAGIIKVLLSMQHKKIPGILHLKELNPYINLNDSPFYLVEKTKDWEPLKDEKGNSVPLRAGVSSFGFGGTNAHIVLEEGQVRPKKITNIKPYYLITLSAKHELSLKQKMRDLLDWIKLHSKDAELESISFTLNTGRTHFDKRCALLVNSLSDLENSLQQLTANQIPINCYMNKTPGEKNEFEKMYNEVLEDIKNNPNMSKDKYFAHLKMIADLYCQNYSIDWELLHRGESHVRCAGLPTYPFAKQHYWFDAEYQSLPVPQKVIQNTTSDLESFTLDYLKQIFAGKLRLTPEQISIDDTYEVYGVDSLIGLEITQILEKDFGNVSKTILYERNHIRDLAAYLQQKFRSKLIEISQTIFQEVETTSATTLTQEEKIQEISEPIAIIGITGIFPQAKNLPEFWANLVEGKNSITEVPPDRWDYKQYPISVGGEEKFFKYGGFIEDADKFDPLFFGIAPREAALMDPQERLFMESCWSTLEDAGYTREKLQQVTQNQVGVFAGVTYNFYPLFIAEEWNKGNRLPLDIQMFSVANRVSYFLNVNGPSFIVDTACSSSLSAIHLACESLQRGECKMALAGGVNLSLHPSKYHFLGGYGFLSEKGQCASFAEGGAGYVPGEGVGTVLLKPLSHAIRDRDFIYGVIKASTMNHGGKTSGYTVPNPNAQRELIKAALDKAKVNARSISYIEAHGTGTALGDPIEVRGLQEAFEQYTNEKQFCSIGSVKSNIGHLESAAGISQLAKVLLQMQHKTLVPSIHAEKLNPFIDFADTPFYVQRELNKWQIDGNPRRAGISSFGAGGTNVHLIVEEYPTTTSAGIVKMPFIFLLSAMNEERLIEYAKNWYSYLNQDSHNQDIPTWLTNVCYTLQTGRESMAARLAILAQDFQDLKDKIHQYIECNNGKCENVWINYSAKLSKENYQAFIHDPKKLIELWIQGCKIAWDDFYGEQKPQRISLPNYPFAKRRCWVTTNETPTKPLENSPIIVKNENTLPTFHDWFYSMRWEEKIISKKDVTTSSAEQWIIFSDEELGFVLQNELGKSSCIYCFVGDKFARFNRKTFYLDPNFPAQFSHLFSEILSEHHIRIKGIIYLWPIREETQNTNSQYLLSLFQALIAAKLSHKIQFCLITRGAQAISDHDSVQLWQYPLWSLTRIFGAEQGNFDVLLLDLDRKKELQNEAVFIAQEIQHYHAEENLIAFRDHKRYVICLTKENMISQEKTFSHPSAVLITGGLGALGSEVAMWLAKEGTRHLLLIGHTPLPERSEWCKLQDPMLVEKTNTIISLEKAGTHVIYVALDITNIAQMENAIARAEKDWKTTIDGVFHLAGVTTDSITIDNMTNETVRKVLAPKVQGALVLHEVFSKRPLNCFVLFSSIAALPFFGMSGLSAYAMANSFLDGLALHRRNLGLKAISINWAAWADKGMSYRYNHSRFLDAVGMATIGIEQGILMLKQLLQSQSPQLIVFHIQWEKFFLINNAAKKLTYFSHFTDKQTMSVTSTSFSKQEISDQLIPLFAKLLQLNLAEIDTNLPYQNYGLDSIIGINFVGELNKCFPGIVSPMDLYRYPTLDLLIDFIFKSQQSTTETETIQASEVITKTEDQFIKDIVHLSEAEVTQLIEDELAGLDDL